MTVVITRCRDGFEQRIAMRDREILLIGRSFVTRQRQILPADLYVSERTPCVLRRNGSRLFLQNPHTNVVCVRGTHESQSVKRGHECDVTQRRVRFCANPHVDGVQSTIFTFRIEDDDDETEGDATPPDM